MEIDDAARLVLDGESLSLRRLLDHLAAPTWEVTVSDSSWTRIERSCRAFDEILRNGDPCYGINTGLGDLIDYPIDPSAQDAFQRRLVLSHAVGTQEPLPRHICRAIVVLRLNCLAKGASGIRRQAVQTLLTAYNAGAYPEIYSTGSLGASGDLAPLSQLAAFLLGQGWGYVGNDRVPAASALGRVGLKPLKLSRKEGLSLINGTSAMVAIGMVAAGQMQLALDSFLVAFALYLDAFRLPLGAFIDAAFDLKPHPGARWVARVISSLTCLSAPTDRANSIDLQPPYSVRCVPLILGPLTESLERTVNTLEIEANSANDNPLYLETNNTIYHGGHFHGQPVAVSLDQLRIAAVHLSGVADRQLEFAFDRRRGVSPTPFLAIDPTQGYCGFEGAQYLVTALHIENKMLAHPLSPHTLPTNSGNQDYVSLGMHSALACLKMAGNLIQVTGIHLAACSQALALQGRDPGSQVLAKVHHAICQHLQLPYKDDRPFNEVVNTATCEQLCNIILTHLRDSGAAFEGLYA